ncbi:hypothetical protein L6164_026438 [Bauhinia variegata]|uniref:Uncharacterized protein n=1 Tax=Bauhinia variegata TaxID=167791 RepID=A0ACB9LQ44_BAUVA|nr:hypothetical protein L6164_026438 [Bauhinia variegata]
MSSSELNQPPLNDPPVEETAPFESKECGESSGAVACPVRLSFQPREDELIAVYLFNKVAGNDDVGPVRIPECDLYGTKNPWEILQEFLEDSNCGSFSEDKNELYLFTTLKKKGTSPSRFDRTVGFGRWRGEGNMQTVFSMTERGERVVVGSKKRYRFEKRGSEHHRTWFMVEYSLANSLLQQIPNPNTHIVLCMIKKNVRVGTEENKPLELNDADAATKQRNGDGKDN